MKKKILSLLLMCALLPLSVLTPEAAQTSYKVSDEYKESIYYRKLSSLELTGNQAADIVAVAKSQLGYHEGNGKAELGGGNTSGDGNYSEYGYWFGIEVKKQGKGHFYDWCAMFVSWCARQAGISTSVISNAAYAAASNSIYDFANLTVHSESGYIPSPGDLIFFCWDGDDSSWDHVGIVDYVQGNSVQTIEGNAQDAVITRSFLLTDNRIRCYGKPNYKGVPSHTYTDDEILSRIDALLSVLRGKRFTTDLADCGNSVCDKCRLSQVIKAPWFVEAFGKTTIGQYPPHTDGFDSDGWSCYAFAEFASWYIFAESADFAVTLKPVGTYKFNYSDMKAHARVGDNLRWDTTAYKSSLNHSAIVISVDSDGVNVLDSNWEYGTYGHNYIRRHKIYFDDEDVKNSPVHISTYANRENCTCVEKYAGVYTTDNVTTSLTIRSGHGTSFASLGSIPANAVFKVTKSNGTWAHVEYNGIKGYASMSYMKRLYIRGDVNGDRTVDASDAIHLLRSVMRPQRYTVNQNPDMNGDGSTNSADAIYLLRHTMRADRYPLAD